MDQTREPRSVGDEDPREAPSPQAMAGGGDKQNRREGGDPTGRITQEELDRMFREQSGVSQR